ncbi:group II intron maturase-specific domain-containing protein [Streptomyces sp. NPDC060030]|uniref:group II intron maturase-specific domain-containing protein n=1 Tax=Streptomyces sp. NPDC060030 TaxID=3347042 RepID=UPI00368D83E1
MKVRELEEEREHTAFTFLWYTFRARKNRSRQGNMFLAVDPAISKDALTRIGREVRGWHLHTRTALTFQELARWVNPKAAGWINYYGRFRPWELIPFMTRINSYLVRWIRKKYKRIAANRRHLRGCRRSPGDICVCSRTGALPPHSEGRVGLMIRTTKPCNGRLSLFNAATVD